MEHHRHTWSVAAVSADDELVLLIEGLVEVDSAFVQSPHGSRPDAVVIDVGDEDAAGFAMLRQFRHTFPESLLVACSPFPDPVTLLSALDAGADTCISTADLWRELLPTLRVALSERAVPVAG